MGSQETWILTNTTGFEPDDFRLQLGQVLTDPRKPSLPLFPDKLNPPPNMAGMQIAQSSGTKFVSGRLSSELDASFGLWANFSVIPGEATIEAAEKRGTTLQWSLEEVSEQATSFSVSHYRAIINRQEVHDFRRFWKMWPALYIVTGIRVAKGAKMELASNHTNDSRLRVGINLDQQAGTRVGFKGGRTRLNDYHNASEKPTDFIFAYQCQKISTFFGPRIDTVRGDTLNASAGVSVRKQDPEAVIQLAPRQPREKFGEIEGDVEEDEILLGSVIGSEYAGVKVILQLGGDEKRGWLQRIIHAYTVPGALVLFISMAIFWLREG